MNPHSDLYDRDVRVWAETQVRLLKQGRIRELDVEHLIAELEDMGKSQLRELESRLIVLIAHLLKWQFQLETLAAQWRDFEGKSWRKTIIEQRVQLAFLLDQVPSLKPALQSAVAAAYPAARRLTIKETNLAPTLFPPTCPYAVDQLLDEDFYPETEGRS